MFFFTISYFTNEWSMKLNLFSAVCSHSEACYMVLLQIRDLKNGCVECYWHWTLAFVILWKYEVISCQSDADYWHKHCFAIQLCNLGDFSTKMKPNTWVLKKKIDLNFFCFYLSKAGLLWTSQSIHVWILYWG